MLYKDARVDQRILDETYGPMGWKRTHQSIDGNLYCMVEIWDDKKKQWIAKQDVGTMSYSEKEKGQASDSFKRACFNWGIGRELYSSPFIWIPSNKVDIARKGDKLVTNERFSVQEILFNEEREVSRLKIMNSAGQTVYEWKMSVKRGVSCVSEKQMETLRNELKRTGVKMQAVLDRYQLSGENQITETTYKKAMNDLKRTKSLEAA